MPQAGDRAPRAPILPVLVAAVGAAALGFLGGVMAQGPRESRFGGARGKADGASGGGAAVTGAPAPATAPGATDGASRGNASAIANGRATEPDAPAPASARGAASGFALAPLGDGHVVEATPDGTLLVLRLASRDATEMGARRLELVGAYRVRNDATRHISEPERRTAHGWYLDDLATEARERLERAQWAFQREAASGSLDAEASARLEARARDVLAAGDASFLADAVADRRYPVRRAAALVLGEAGFLAAVPALVEMLESEPTPDLVRRARAALALLLGQPVRDAASARALHDANPPPHRLARRDAAADAGGAPAPPRRP